MELIKRRRSSEWPVLWLALSLACLSSASQELRYSVFEEQKPGSFVGNVAKDLELNTQRISERKLSVISEGNDKYFELDPTSGVLVLKETIDREYMCGLGSKCTLTLKILLQNPLSMCSVIVEIVDVNDNAPQFPARNTTLEISEAAALGTRFRLESAQDPDVGINSLRTYHLAPNDCFVLNVDTKSDGSKFPELVLEKALDRESQATFRLLLTAVDGGQPEKSGTTLVLIKILDVNDNAPVFDEPVKRVSLIENSPLGTLVTKLNATDVDYGPNGEISFLFSKYTPGSVLKLFSVDAKTGEIRVIGNVDYEEASIYDVTVQARDSGSPAMEGSCNIKIEIMDVNDYTPEVTLTSLISTVSEDASPGTVIALISVKDLDSGKNGEVALTVPTGLPFKLKSTFGEHYTLVTDGPLDREDVAEYTVFVTATDSGSPPLSSQKTFVVRLSDVNDNAPVFSQPSYSVDIMENNAPSASIVTVSASDPDSGENAHLRYYILDSKINGSPVSSFVYINSETGSIYTMRSLDYEQMNMFKVEVQVRDAGIPPHSSNVTVHVFVIDQNDNPPIILYPTHTADAGMQLTVPHAAPVGHFVNKIVAVDPDSGHNAWLFYSIAPGDDAAMFRIGTHTGEVRTARKLAEDEQGGKVGSAYSFVVVVHDNGKPEHSTSIAVTITVEEKGGADTSSDFQKPPFSRKRGGISDLTLYLIVSLGFVTLVCVITMVVLVVRCLRHKDNSSCCYPKKGLRSRHSYQQRNKDLHLQLNTDGPIRYMEVVGGPQEPHTRTYRPCYSTLSSRSDFVFVKTPMLSHNNTLNMTLTRKHLMDSANEQKPPNSDWRFTQNQRPGPSGAAGPEVAVGTGPWPNPPTEAEQLQALMAAANEVSEATNTLGPGTMGLSTRYSPQFTLQHVPDYRQNVYIPGSTATLTAGNQQQLQQLQQPQQPQQLQQLQQLQQALPPPQAASAQPEPPKATQTPASKKKSTKKEKK